MSPLLPLVSAACCGLCPTVGPQCSGASLDSCLPLPLNCSPPHYSRSHSSSPARICLNFKQQLWLTEWPQAALSHKQQQQFIRRHATGRWTHRLWESRRTVTVVMRPSRIITKPSESSSRLGAVQIQVVPYQSERRKRAGQAARSPLCCSTSLMDLGD